MSRTVTALYDSRAEAEAARARLVSDVKTRSTRFIARDTAAAVDTLEIEPRDAQVYREAIRQGGHLLVAEIEAGQDPKKVIAALEEVIGTGAPHSDDIVEDAPQTFGVTPAAERPAPPRSQEPRFAARPPVPPVEPAAPRQVAPQSPQRNSEQPPAQQQAVRQPPVREERIPLVEEELRVDTRQVSRGGARVRSVIREAPAEEQVNLTQERVDLENRPSERRLSFEEVKAGGLLRDRIFEIREMREEPVITKEAFVREEVIVRKTVQERTETIRDTVRRTEVEVEELPVGDEPRRGSFGGRPDRR
jgi:stress response protein YsnF